MEDFDEFISTLRNDEEKENYKHHIQWYTSLDKNQLLPKNNQQKMNDDVQNNNEEFIDVSESLNLDDLIESMHEIHHTKKPSVLKQIDVPISRIKSKEGNLPSKHKQHHHIQPIVSINDDVEFMPKKMKLSHFASSLGLTSHGKVGVYEGTSNNNNNSNRSDENNPKSDQNVSENVKEKRIARHFYHESSSDEKSEDDEYELEKELKELHTFPPRQKCVNVNDVSTKCKFFINFEKFQSKTNVDINHMPLDLSLLNYIKNMKNKLKCIYEPKRSIFYKQLVKTSKDFEVFNLKEGYSNITAEKDMVNLFDALKLFEKTHKVTIKFAKSKLGDALKQYSANRDVCWDVVHMYSNSNEDLLKYRLCYGAIPRIYIFDLEIIVTRVLLIKFSDKGKTSTNSTNKLQNKNYDFLEGELELLIFKYWQISTRDIFGYKEHLSRKKDKMVFYYMFKKMQESIIQNDFDGNKKRKDVFMNIMTLFKSYAAFENPSILTAASLVFVKNSVCKLVSFLGEHYDLWSVFFHKFNLHSTAFDYTIKVLFEDRDSIFHYLFTRLLEINQFNISGSAKSLWYHGIAQTTTTVELDSTIISRTDVVNCLSYYFSKPTNVPRAICVKLDNYYFLYIDLFVSFIINSNLYKYQRKLTAENCNYFFISNDRKYHDYYSINFIPAFETKRMITSMKKMVNLQLDARLDGELSWKLKIDSDVVVRFFELVHRSLNYALTPAMLREGPVLTDVEWAAIFINDLDKIELLYLNESRWQDKPCMLSGAADDLDYDPETEDLDPLKDVCSADFTYCNITDDDDGYAYSEKFGPSSDEETDFNSDESEAERLEVVDEFSIKKKNERLIAECKYLNQGIEHEIFNRKISNIIQDRIQKVGYFSKLTPKKQKKTATEGKNVGKVQVKTPEVSNGNGVMTLKAERDMVAAGVLDVYTLKNEKTCVKSSDMFNVFGLIPKNKFKNQRNSKGCALCPNSKIASYNMLVSENVAVACCLMCIEDVANVIKATTYSFEKLQNVLESRIELRFKSPLLFDKNRQILTKMPPMRSHNDMYCSTFNKLDPKCGKILTRIAVFSHHFKHVNRSSL